MAGEACTEGMESAGMGHVQWEMVQAQGLRKPVRKVQLCFGPCYPP